MMEAKWYPIEELKKEHLPVLIKGGTYDWSDSWNNEFIPYKGISLVYSMPDKRNDYVFQGDNCGGHDLFYWHKPKWFFSVGTLGEP